MAGGFQTCMSWGGTSKLHTKSLQSISAGFSSGPSVTNTNTGFYSIIPLISISVPTSFSRLHLLRSIQTLLAGYWFHLSHCINPPGTKKEVIAGNLDAAQSCSASLFILLSWPLVFPRLFSSRKLSLSERIWGDLTICRQTHTRTHTHNP